MLQESNKFSQSYVVQILTFVYSSIEIICSILNGQSTVSYLSLQLKDIIDTDARSERGRPTSRTLQEFWNSATQINKNDKNKLFYDGDLNQIIFQLIEPDVIDNLRLHSFIQTYKSFTNPKELIDTLTTCYSIPNGLFSPEKTQLIQQRVCDFIINWMQTQFLDLNTQVSIKLIIKIKKTIIINNFATICNVRVKVV